MKIFLVLLLVTSISDIEEGRKKLSNSEDIKKTLKGFEEGNGWGIV
ncbi:hypothetical protein KKG61_08140 [bacterium]|nr:hypothetical protein [bacterium]MBU1600051.1 hypothetical protein [bacterium]MBU2462184.1 hypothetical protein [bacterium]